MKFALGLTETVIEIFWPHTSDSNNAKRLKILQIINKMCISFWPSYIGMHQRQCKWKMSEHGYFFHPRYVVAMVCVWLLTLQAGSKPPSNNLTIDQTKVEFPENAGTTQKAFCTVAETNPDRVSQHSPLHHSFFFFPSPNLLNNFHTQLTREGGRCPVDHNVLPQKTSRTIRIGTFATVTVAILWTRV